MEPSILDKAQADLERSTARVAKLRDDLAKAEADAKQMTVVVSWLRKQMGLPDAGNGDPAAARPRAVAASDTKTGQLVRVAIHAIKEAGRPLSIAELHDAVERAGLDIGGAQPRANLAGYLSRDARVEFVRGVGWRTVNDEGPAEARPDVVGDVAERFNAPDSKSGGEGPQKQTPVGSNPTVSAPYSARAVDLLSSTSAFGQYPGGKPHG